MKAIAYYRVSSAQQAEKESIDLQKYAHKDFFQDNGYELVAEFEDDGISGESINKRLGFQKALARIEKNDIDVFVVYLVDRIGRFKLRRDRNRVIELLEESQTHVHVSEDDIIFHWNREKEINDLEYELNASRRENVIRGKRIHKGHTAKRLKGRFSGGLLPYGIGFDKERGIFNKVPAEVETLKTVIEKLTSGWGLHRVRDFLNDHPDLYPKRVRNYKGKPVTKWSAENIREMILKDFLFTGIVARTPKSIKKGIPPIDTGIKLFNEEVVKAARREMRVRRVRKIDPAYPNRKRIHSQQDKTVFTDALLHGIARCGHCGWKLGLQRTSWGDRYNYLYYICRGRSKGKCDLKNIRTDKLDENVWRKFVQTLSDPNKVERMILDQNFIIDKGLEEKQAQFQKAQADIKKISNVIERTKKQYRWGHITEDEHSKEITNVERILNEAQERAGKLEQIITQPKAVKETVKKATKYMADQLAVFWHLDKIEALKADVDKLIADANEHPEGTETEKLKKLYLQIEAATTKLELLDLGVKIVDKLKKERKGISPEDRKNPDIINLAFQQRRRMLQQFIDHSDGKGIRVFDANNFTLNLYVRFYLFNDFRNKEGKDEQGNREKNFNGNQLCPVTGYPNLL